MASTIQNRTTSQEINKIIDNFRNGDDILGLKPIKSVIEISHGVYHAKFKNGTATIQHDIDTEELILTKYSIQDTIIYPVG